VLGNVFLGERWAKELWLDHPRALSITIGLVAAAVFALLFVRATPTGRRWGAAALGSSLLIYTATTFYRGTEAYRLVFGHWNFAGARYAGAAMQLAVASVVILIAHLRASDVVRNVVIAVIAIHAIVIPATTLHPRTQRSPGPTWAAGLRVSRRLCEEQHLERVLVSITPFAWTTEVPCDRFR